MESYGASVEDFLGGDAGHHVGGAVVAEVELVAVLDVLDDVGFAFVGGGFLGVRWSEESDEGAFESDGHVEGGGVVGDDELGSGDDGHQQGDGGGSDAVGDFGVVGCEFEQGGAVEAFSWASNDDGAVDVGVLGEFFGEFGEAFDGPTLGGPSGSRREDGVGLGVLDDDLREFFLSGVVGDIRVSDVSAGGFGEGEHAVDGMH